MTKQRLHQIKDILTNAITITKECYPDKIITTYPEYILELAAMGIELIEAINKEANFQTGCAKIKTEKFLQAYYPADETPYTEYHIARKSYQRGYEDALDDIKI